MNSTSLGSSTHIEISTHILQWNSHGIIKKRAEVALKVRENSISVLAYSEGALPGTETIPGYLKYVVSALRSFPHGNAALYVHQEILQTKLNRPSLPSGDYECVAAKVQTGARTFTVATVYVRAERRGIGAWISLRVCALLRRAVLSYLGISTPIIPCGVLPEPANVF